MTCVKQKNAGGDQLVFGERAALVAGTDQLGNKIVGRGGAFGLDMATDVVGEFGRGLRRILFDFARAPRLIHRDHFGRPIKELRGVLFGHPEQPANDDDGDRSAKRLEQIEVAFGKVVDQTMRQRPNFGFERFDPPRGKGPQHKRP